MSKYKDRKNVVRPKALSDIREAVPLWFNVEFSDNNEADDVISQYQYLGHKTGQRIIAATEDKDALQTSGLLYNLRSKELINCSGFGYIHLVTKETGTKKIRKLKGYGRLFLYYQILCGDKVDTYNPFPKQMTDLQFYNLFENVKTDEEAWTLIAQKYKEHYEHITEWVTWTGDVHKGTWVDLLQCYCDVAHMQRWEGDRLNVKNVLKKYNLI